VKYLCQCEQMLLPSRKEVSDGEIMIRLASGDKKIDSALHLKQRTLNYKLFLKFF
jgi:predicted HicB family RNase H-like nuclease